MLISGSLVVSGHKPLSYLHGMVDPGWRRSLVHGLVLDDDAAAADELSQVDLAIPIALPPYLALVVDLKIFVLEYNRWHYKFAALPLREILFVRFQKDGFIAVPIANGPG